MKRLWLLLVPMMLSVSATAQDASVTFGDQRLSKGSKAKQVQEGTWYSTRESSATPDEEVRTFDLQRYAARKIVVDAVNEQGRATALSVKYGLVVNSAQNPNGVQRAESPLSYQKFKFEMGDGLLGVTHKNGKEITALEAEKLMDDQGFAINPTSFAWVRGQTVSPGDALNLTTASEGFFESFLEDGDVVDLLITYVGEEVRDKKPCGRFDIMVKMTAASPYGAATLKLKGKMWAQIESGWVQELDLFGEFAAAETDGEIVSVSEGHFNVVSKIDYTF